MSTNTAIVWLVGFWFVLIMGIMAIDTRKPAPQPDQRDARIRTLEAKVSRLQDELEFRQYQTSSTISKGE